MSAAFLLVRLGAATLVFTMLACLMMLARRRLRAWIGAEAVYGLWLAVPIGVALCCWPVHRVLVQVHLPPAAPAVAATAAAVSTAPASILPDGATLLLCAWLSGAAASALLLVLRQWRWQTALGPLQRIGADAWLSARSDLGPMLVGLPRPRIVVPIDFAERYTSDEQAAILAHERTHRRRGDLWWNALAALLRCAFWFHPLASAAQRLYSADQELACDSAVLRSHRLAPRTYSQALLKTQTGASLPLACTMHAGSALKERILNLQRGAAPRRMRVAALLVLASLGLAGGRIAWAASLQVVKVGVAAPVADRDATVPAPAVAALAPARVVHAAAPERSRAAPAVAVAAVPAVEAHAADATTAQAAQAPLPVAEASQDPDLKVALDLSIDGAAPRHEEHTVRDTLHLDGLRDADGRACDAELLPQLRSGGLVDLRMQLVCDGRPAGNPRVIARLGEPATIAIGRNERQPDGSYAMTQGFRITVRVDKP
jgi:beta-lactamase regulating signal transducer with metallopeptidase domain